MDSRHTLCSPKHLTKAILIIPWHPMAVATMPVWALKDTYRHTPGRLPPILLMHPSMEMATPKSWTVVT